MAKIRRLNVTLGEFTHMVVIIHITMTKGWNTTVPIVPGKKYEVQD